MHNVLRIVRCRASTVALFATLIYWKFLLAPHAGGNIVNHLKLSVEQDIGVDNKAVGGKPEESVSLEPPGLFLFFQFHTFQPFLSHCNPLLPTSH